MSWVRPVVVGSRSGGDDTKSLNPASNNPSAVSAPSLGVPAPALPSGEVTTLGDFELRRELGRGGMGTVYEAWQRSLQRIVALKVLSGHVSATPKAIVRFQREGQAAAKLHHTHIVPIFAQGEVDGTYYYAMELVEGASLNNLISELRSEHLNDASTVDLAETVALDSRAGSTPAEFPPSSDAPASKQDVSVSAVMLQAKIGERNSPQFFNAVAGHIADVADALEYAHLRSIIHRDVKPHNLVLGLDGRIRVLDFGLARLMEQPGVTMTGEMIGSPLYMSPEQITGNPEDVDHRSDIYSLGATLYEWLTLTPPYPGETRERVISKIMSSDPVVTRVHNPAIPLDLETICMKAIERNPDRRYQTAGEFRDDLRRFVAKRPIVARRIGVGGRFAKFVSRHQLGTLGAAAVIVAVALGWGMYTKNRSAKVEAKAAAEARESQELVLDLFSKLPLELRAPLRGLEAAAPMVENAVRSDGLAAIMQGIGGDTSATGPTAGTAASMIRRLALDFYEVVAPRDFLGTAGGADEAMHLAEAADRWRAGDREGSVKLLNEYLKATPDDFDARQFHAILCAQLGQFDKMTEDADAMVALRGNQTSVYLWRGIARLLVDRVESGLEDVNMAASMDPQSIWVKVLKGFAFVLGDRAMDALTYFDEALRGSPGSVVARMGRAFAEQSLGRFQDAVMDASEVIRIEPSNADALIVRGDCYANLSDFASAAKDYQRAMAVAGRTPALALRYLQALVGQRAGDAKIGDPKLTPEGQPKEGAADPDGEASQGPLFDWINRKIRPRSNGRDGR